MDGFYELIHFFSSCVANSPVYKGVCRKISRGRVMEKPRKIAPISFPPVYQWLLAGALDIHPGLTFSSKRCIKSPE